MSSIPYLLNDAERAAFTVRGYHLIEADFPPGFNDAVCEELGRLLEDPGESLLYRVPKLHDVYDPPRIHGALASLLGDFYEMKGLPRCHIHLPGTGRRGWTCAPPDPRRHRPDSLLLIYYPQDVFLDLGPTMVIPGTHFRDDVRGRLGTIADFPGQIPLEVRAGTVVIMHPCLWHTAAPNIGRLTRYMVRFVFGRTPHSPSPARDRGLQKPALPFGLLSADMPRPCSVSSHYRELLLRLEMWNYLTGGS